LAQVTDITSAELATTLALRILPEKNKLTAADAMLVEQAFEQKLTAFPSHDGGGSARYGIHGERPSTLEPEQSAALREKLLTAVGNITSADSAVIWAREALADKNRLAAANAKLVEDAFEHRLSELAPSATVGAADDAAPTTRIERVGVHEMRAKGKEQPTRLRV
jgi:hypothetical protein